MPALMPFQFLWKKRNDKEYKNTLLIIIRPLFVNAHVDRLNILEYSILSNLEIFEPTTLFRTYLLYMR